MTMRRKSQPGTARSPVLAALLTAAAVALTGCEASRMAESNIAAANTEAEVNTRRAQEPVPTRPADAVLVSEDVWLGRDAFEAIKGDPLPPDTDQFTFVSAVPQTLAQVTAEITALTGIPVALEMVTLENNSPDTAAATAGADETAEAAEEGEADAAGGLTVAGDTEPDPTQGGTQLTGPPGLVIEELNYSGTLAGFMDYLSNLVQADWSYENGRIRIFNQITRTFTVIGAPGQQIDNSQITGGLGIGEEGESNSAQVIVQRSVTTDLLVETGAVVESIVGDLGSVAVNQASNSISVVGPFYLMHEVEAYMNDLNRRLARQVTIDVRLLSVRIRNEDTYRNNIEAIISGDSFLNRDLSFDLGSNAGFANTLTSPILFGGTLTGSGDTYSALIEALSQVGEVSLVTSASLTTRNGQPAPFNNTESEDFVSRLESETTTNAGTAVTTVTADIATLTRGFTFTVTPRILGSGQVLVRYSANLAQGVIPPREVLGVAPNVIEVTLPIVRQQAINQNFIANSQETIVVAGFERSLSTRDRAGTGTPGNMLFSGQRDAVAEREFFVVLLTPRVQDFGKSFASLNR